MCHRDYAAAIEDFQAALTNWGGLSSELSTRLAQAIRAAEDSMAREQAHAATKISAVRRGQQGRARAAQLKADKAAAAARQQAAKPSSSKAGAARRPRRSSFETDESAMASALQAAAAEQEEEEEQEQQGKPTAAAVASLVPPSPGNLPDGGASSMAMPSKPPRCRHLGYIIRHLARILLKIPAVSLLQAACWPRAGSTAASRRLSPRQSSPRPQRAAASLSASR